MKPTVYALAVFIGVLALPGARAGEDEKDKEKAAKPAEAGAPNMEEMMKKMQEYATPSAGHKVLEPLVGEWAVEARCWMAGPDAPPQVSKGTAKVEWMLGGRYLREQFSGEMMQRPFQGVGITAYDNFKKKYAGIWMDSMGTGIFISEGSADDAGQVLTFEGKCDDPMTGQKDKPTKYMVHIVSPDKHLMEMHDLTLGEKTKVMELTYTRKPKELTKDN